MIYYFQVTALLALSEGAQFVTNGLLYVTERLRLGPHGATSLVVRVLVSTPGLKNMTVEVNGYSSSACDVIGSNNSNNESLAGAVVRSDTVLVHPEGLVRQDTESAYFCANGKYFRTKFLSLFRYNLKKLAGLIQLPHLY